jgi:AcrR family transcriptional regulator
MHSDTILYVKKAKRLTRQESQQDTRRRLLQAAEQAFIRQGFDAASVEQIAENAGFSRGAFYSNFRSKDELFIEVLQIRRREIEAGLDAIIRRERNPAARLRAVLDWYVNEDLNRGWIILEAEFTLRALRNRGARSRLAKFHRQRIADYSALVTQYFNESKTEALAPSAVIAVALFGAARGLGELALLEPDAAGQKLYGACRDLVFKQMIPCSSRS